MVQKLATVLLCALVVCGGCLGGPLEPGSGGTPTESATSPTADDDPPRTSDGSETGPGDIQVTVVYVTDPPEDAILNTYSAEDTSNPHLERALDVEPLSNGSGTVSKYIVQSENASAFEDAFARYNYSKTANGTDVSGYYFERDGHVFAVTWITFV